MKPKIVNGEPMMEHRCTDCAPAYEGLSGIYIQGVEEALRKQGTTKKRLSTLFVLLKRTRIYWLSLNNLCFFMNMPMQRFLSLIGHISKIQLIARKEK